MRFDWSPHPQKILHLGLRGTFLAEISDADGVSHPDLPQRCRPLSQRASNSAILRPSPLNRDNISVFSHGFVLTEAFAPSECHRGASSEVNAGVGPILLIPSSLLCAPIGILLYLEKNCSHPKSNPKSIPESSFFKNSRGGFRLGMPSFSSMESSRVSFHRHILTALFLCGKL